MMTLSGARGVLRRRPVLAGSLAALALFVLGSGLYGTLRAWSNRDGACAPARAALARMAPLARGEVAAFAVAADPVAAPPLAFGGPDGETRGLRPGRVSLLNLWATWCEPCRREMPALDALQAAMGSGSFEVVAVNIDTRDTGRPRAWLAEIGATRLAYHADPQARIFQDLRNAGLAQGMPTTILVDGAGCLLGRLSGPAEWASPDAMALLRAALGPS